MANLVKASGLSRAKVKEYLDGSATYTKFRQAPARFNRLKVHSYGINHIWSMDVAFMDKLSLENTDYKYLLLAVDVLSRYLRVEPMKTKSSLETSQAFEKMTAQISTLPQKVWIDEGTEFEGSFATLCEELGIHRYHTYTENKSLVAERFVRTLKTLIYRYLDANRTSRYINHLQRFVQLINNRINRGIGMAPSRVTLDHTEYLIALSKPVDPNQIKPKKRRKKARYKVGQTVRAVLKKDIFNKGYKQSYSDEVYKILRVSDKTHPITYWLQDIEQRTIKRRFYEKQLVPYAYHESLRRARHQRILN